MNECFEAAMELSRLGYHVIPCNGKIPLVEWKRYQNEKPTEVLLGNWWGHWPEANLAIILGRGTCAVDVDGQEGWDALRRLQIVFEDVTPSVRTGRPDGRHFYCRGSVPDKVRVLPGVDVRGLGICVAPPSIHENGTRYSWVTPITSPDRLPGLPAPLLDVLTAKAFRTSQTILPGGLYAPEHEEWVAKLLIEGSPEGQRNADGTRLAGYLFRNLPADIARACLLGWADRCSPPLDRREAASIADSIARRARVDRVLPAISETKLREETEARSSAQEVGYIIQGISEDIHIPTEFISFPFPTLNDLLFGGMTREEYLILGGRPSVGKTALVVQCAKHTAKQGGRVLFVTLEMSPRQLAARLAVLWSGIPAGEIRRGGLSGGDLSRFKLAAQQLRSLPIVIESGLESAEQMYSFVEKAQQDGQPFDLMILDYLQCVRPLVGKKDSFLEIDQISAALKAIPRRLKTPMIAVSSMSRNEGDVSMHQLRGSGKLEFDADIVVLMSRDKFDPRIKLTVGKARDAQIGQFSLYYDGASYSFSETPKPEAGAKAPEFEEPF